MRGDLAGVCFDTGVAAGLLDVDGREREEDDDDAGADDPPALAGLAADAEDGAGREDGDATDDGGAGLTSTGRADGVDAFDAERDDAVDERFDAAGAGAEVDERLEVA